jgi:hypothetical protein
MAIAPDTLQIELIFNHLKTTSGSATFPQPGSLSSQLNSIIDVTKGDYTENVKKETVMKFGTASIEMWHRSIHSFLISAALTKASPVWSSVAGYYSSHYAVRAFSHLFGHFQLYKLKRIVQLQISGSNYYCHISSKKAGEREHKASWKYLKSYSPFDSDPFFTINDDNLPNSDGAHRNKANYQDHIGRFPIFQSLDDEYMKRRFEQISSIQLSDAPIPNTDSYPDLESVQLIAYHRLIRYRIFLDEILGGSNRFWSVNRKPNWCPSYFDFQVSQPEYSTIYQGLV